LKALILYSNLCSQPAVEVKSVSKIAEIRYSQKENVIWKTLGNEKENEGMTSSKQKKSGVR
jgi:hypothetical protein